MIPGFEILIDALDNVSFQRSSSFLSISKTTIPKNYETL